MGAAFDQFKESLELASALKRIERERYAAIPKANQQPLVKGLRGGAAVLMVAAFEYFLRKLFEENISKLNTVPQTIDISKLPDDMKITAVFKGIQRAMNGPQFESKPPKVQRIKDILDASKLLINDHVNPETFSETGSNPNSETVKTKFKEVGIADIFRTIKTDFERKWNQPVANDFIALKLDAIVRSRHVVAHTADTLHITRKTQNEAFKFLRILSELLEKELEQHIRQLLVSARR